MGKSGSAEKFRQGLVDSTQEEPPAPAYITWLHSLAPYRNPTDLHHRLGTEGYDAAAGNHRHRGTDNSVPLFSGSDPAITGDLATAGGQLTALRGVIALLVRVGATNSTTN